MDNLVKLICKMLLCQRYISLGLATLTLLAVVAKVQSKPASMTSRKEIYLPKFDYLLDSVCNPANTGLLDSKTLYKCEQRFVSPNTTGDLDNDKRELMLLPRCGVRHTMDFRNHNRLKRYALSGRYWPKKKFTYRIMNYPKRMRRANVDIIIARAFDVWSEYTDLSFTPKEAGVVDIKIRFVKGEHDDIEEFDGPGGALAHVPFLSKEVHFDDAENWSIFSSEGINLLQVATHEFGHILGLSHSNVASAVMSDGYYGYIPNFILDDDDILGIQRLYGKKSPPSLCEDPKIDTIFKSADGLTYVFKGNIYYKISNLSVANGYPKLISEGWPGLPGDIDAALTFYTGSTLFFKGTKYWHYIGRQLQKDFPRDISKDFIGIPNNLDAAMAWGNIIYFFKGSQFWRYDPMKEQGIDAGYPKPISIWKGLPNNLDAAYRYSHGSMIFFKNYKLYHLNATANSIDSAVTPYHCVSSHWFGCKNTLCSYSNIWYFLQTILKILLAQL